MQQLIDFVESVRAKEKNDQGKYPLRNFGLIAFSGSGWWHWVIFNIPANVTKLQSNAGDLSKGLAPENSVQSVTDFGKPGYGGPCPPKGDLPHWYQITVYALKTEKLPLDKTAPAAMVGFYLHQNMLAKTVLKAHYSR